jgi:hypothetical protein
MAKQSRMDSGIESVYTENGGSHIIDLLTHVKQCKTENILINNVLLYFMFHIWLKTKHGRIYPHPLTYEGVLPLKVHKHEIFFFDFFEETETLWSQVNVTRDF